jgi:anti-sigma factor ChrR (cupin superfamily)
MNTDDDLKAAEYALGTLSKADREAFEHEMRHNPGALAAAEAWEDRLGGLADTGESVPPPDHIFAAIEAELDTPIPLADASVTIRADDDVWVPVREGLEKKLLFRDEAKGVESFILRYAPGTQVSAHVHTSVEECFLLEGDLKLGDVELSPGDFHVALPGTEHASGETVGGALLLVRVGIR